MEAAFSGYAERLKHLNELATYQALQTAALSRIPKNKALPTLDKLLGYSIKAPVRKQTAEDMLAAFEAMRERGEPINIRRID